MKQTKIKPLLASMLFIFLGSVTYYFSIENVCFDLSDKAIICYQQNKYLNNKVRITNEYIELINNIDTGASLKTVVKLSSKLENLYGYDNGYEKVRKSFLWAKENSLIYIIENNDFSALLLQKPEGDNYVLYFDMINSVFYFDLQSPIIFLPIDNGWVNEGYEGGFEIQYSKLFLDRSECYFRKGIASINTKHISKNGKNIICDYGRYLGVSSDRTNRYKFKPKNVNPQSLGYEVDDTLQFIRWVAE